MNFVTHGSFFAALYFYFQIAATAVAAYQYGTFTLFGVACSSDDINSYFSTLAAEYRLYRDQRGPTDLSYVVVALDFTLQLTAAYKGPMRDIYPDTLYERTSHHVDGHSNVREAHHDSMSHSFIFGLHYAWYEYFHSVKCLDE